MAQQIETPELLTNREVEQLKLNIARLLVNVADRSTCRGCRAEIWWLVHRNGKKAPYDRDGTNHFITCSQAKEFKRK